MSEQARLEAIVHGHVQGVNFRYYTHRQASALGLTGYVRNEWEGTVRVVAEGDKPQLASLLAWLHRGPPSADVERVDVTWKEFTGEFQRFEVRY